MWNRPPLIVKNIGLCKNDPPIILGWVFYCHTKTFLEKTKLAPLNVIFSYACARARVLYYNKNILKEYKNI